MTDRFYTTQDLSYVTRFAGDIKNYAALMGVSATAVAVAIAKAKIWGQTPMKSIACVCPSVLRRRRVVLSRQRVSNDVVCDSGQSDRLCCGTGKGNLWAAHDCGWRHPS